MTCNATLTTATVSCGEDDCGSVYHQDHIELHTLTCHRSEGHDGSRPSDTYIGVHRGDGVKWDDDTEGATPHTPVSTVTEGEVEAAMSALGFPDVVTVREALEAAAAVRDAQEGDR